MILTKPSSPGMWLSKKHGHAHCTMVYQ